MKRKISIITISALAVSVFVLFSLNIINVKSEEVSLENINIIFPDYLKIPEYYREPIVKTINDNLSKLKTTETEFITTYYSINDKESYITLVPYYVVKSGWNVELKDDDIIELIIRKNKNELDIDIINDESIYQLDYTPPPVNYIPDYYLPWTKNTNWAKTQGWHQGNSIDFAPVTGGAAVLATGSGRVTGICSDPYQVHVKVSHPDPDTDWTEYTHIATSTYDSDLTNKYIPEGQYLGDVYNGTANSNPVCDPIIYPDLQYNTACGCGDGQHLHFTVSRTDMKFQGSTANTIASSANGTKYTSQNRRIGICDDPPGSGNWNITDSCSILESTNFSNNINLSNNSILAIPDTIVLNLNLGSYSLNVANGSGILINNGGKID